MKTTTTLLFFFITFISFRASAGDPVVVQQSCMFRAYSANDSLDKVRFQKSLVHWRKMKNTGTVLTATGGGLFVVGEACLWTSFARDINTNTSSEQDKLWVSGAVITAAAVALIIPGAVMLAKSVRRYNRMRLGHSDKDKAFDGVTL